VSTWGISASVRTSPSAGKPNKALQFQHSLVRAILEVSPDGILVVNDENLIVAHNKRFLDIWQIPLARYPG
jgi:PAS domain-containing protein